VTVDRFNRYLILELQTHFPDCLWLLLLIGAILEKAGTVGSTPQSATFQRRSMPVLVVRSRVKGPARARKGSGAALQPVISMQENSRGSQWVVDG
jgi:hypothetical protein